MCSGQNAKYIASGTMKCKKSEKNYNRKYLFNIIAKQ